MGESLYKGVSSEYKSTCLIDSWLFFGQLRTTYPVNPPTQDTQKLFCRIFSNTLDQFFFSGSKDFAVDIGNTTGGPWTQIADGQLETSTPFPRREIFLDEPHFGRFIQYRCITGFGSYCGLQYIGVFNTGGVPMCICEQGN